MQRGVAKGLKVHCLFVITEVSIRCQKKPGGWYTPYTRVYPPPNTPLVLGYFTPKMGRNINETPKGNPCSGPRRLSHQA